jgi:trehalose utilization protein
LEYSVVLAGSWIAAEGFTRGIRLLDGGVRPAQAPSTPLPRRRVVRVWSEGTAPASVYPKDIRGAVADSLAHLRGYDVKTATLTDPDQGVSQADLDATDVLIWWGHQKHGDVTDATVERIVKRVRDGGMGVIFLHSAHYAKPLKAVLGASGAWKAYVNDGKPQHLHVTDARHPIARGVRDFTFPREERYEEPFVVPTPEAVVFDALHEATGTRARQGLCWTIGKGRVFYFRPGHEEFPVYFMPEVRRILRNAVLWAANEEEGIWEDNDPAAPAARATREPPLALILRNVSYGGTEIIAGGEVAAQAFVRAGRGPVKTYPVASYGLIKDCAAGWYTPEGDGPKRRDLWKVEAKFNKQDRPPLAKGAKTEFDPGDKPFGLWVSTGGFTAPPEFVCTGDADNAAIKRFGGKPIHKARVYAAVRSDGTAVPNAYLIGWEYSTNDDFQDIVTLVENVKPAPSNG